MLLQNEARDVSKSGVLQTAKATIKTSPKIFNFFADQTYANKPRAICRELVANAVDSHVMAGKGKIPVEVWLPNLTDPVFRVKDQGLGMSHEFMMTNFMQYADGSTKDSSNIAIGGFGIGSKSPFAYVDQYTVASVFDGTKSVYSVFKDEDGIPSIALLAQQSTDESNGVEVSFPVEADDFNLFLEAAMEALKYFDPLPIVRGAGMRKLEPPVYASEGKLWGMRKTSGPLQVIMGGVMYPVDANSLTYKFNDEKARRLLNYGLDIRVPIGTCSIALSREQLSYDEATIAGLTKALNNVIDEVAASFSTMFDKYTNKWAASAALGDEVHGGNSYGGTGPRGQFLANHATWKGKPLTVDIQVYLENGVYWQIDRKQYRRSTNCPNPRWETISSTHGQQFRPWMFEAVFIDDLPRNSASKTIAKIKYHVDENLKNDKAILVIRAEDEKVKLSTITKALGDIEDYILTSSLADPPKTVSAKYIRPKVRLFTYDGSRSYSWGARHDNLKPGTYGKPGIKEIPYADQPSKGIIVECDKWNLPHGFYQKIDTGIIYLKELHFANKGDVNKLDEKDWVRFDKEFNKRLKAKLRAYKDLGAQLAVEEHLEKFDLLQLSKINFHGVKLPSNTPLKNIMDLYTTYVKPITANARTYERFVTKAMPKGVDAEKDLAAFKKKSPRAYRLLQLLRFDIKSKEDAQFVVDNM